MNRLFVLNLKAQISCDMSNNLSTRPLFSLFQALLFFLLTSFCAVLQSEGLEQANLFSDYGQYTL